MESDFDEDDVALEREERSGRWPAPAVMDEIRQELVRLDVLGGWSVFTPVELLGGSLAKQLSAGELRRWLEPESVLAHLRSVPADAAERAYMTFADSLLANVGDESAWPVGQIEIGLHLQRVAPDVSVRRYRVMDKEYFCLYVGERHAQFMERELRPEYTSGLLDILGDLPDGAGEESIVACCRAHLRGQEAGYEKAHDEFDTPDW